MGKINTIFILGLTATLLTLMTVSDAEARRLGGGRSFGGKSVYSSPYKRSQLSRQQALAQQKAVQRNQTARQSWRNRGGLLGWLAPLALGGLLGALFFGGAFEHLNLMDMLVFGGLAWLGFKLLAGRASGAGASAYAGRGETTSDYSQHRSTPPPFATDLLNKPKTGGMAFEASDFQTGVPVKVPEDFDVESFLNGAKRAFLHLQEAWNRGDLADIRELTTDEVFIEIKSQKQASIGDLPTEIEDVEAELVGFQENDSVQEAAVLFTAQIREGSHDPETIQEVWHFIRPRHHLKPQWLLDGIQQVDA